ncbi:MAG: dihydroneopterin aldolase [Microthrixaceae bacterium]|nr:dihydroneopterin aldolase [Microthrixaceae bacterium]
MSDVDRLELSGLAFTAVVGVLPEERTRAQPLRADLVLEVDLSAAGRTDRLEDTVDYGMVCDVAVQASAGAPKLLEHMAETMVAAVFGCDSRISAVELHLAKLRPPVPHALDGAGVRIVRRSVAGDGH